MEEAQTIQISEQTLRPDLDLILPYDEVKDQCSPTSPQAYFYRICLDENSGFPNLFRYERLVNFYFHCDRLGHAIPALTTLRRHLKKVTSRMMTRLM